MKRATENPNTIHVDAEQIFRSIIKYCAGAELINTKHSLSYEVDIKSADNYNQRSIQEGKTPVTDTNRMASLQTDCRIENI